MVSKHLSRDAQIFFSLVFQSSLCFLHTYPGPTQGRALLAFVCLFRCLIYKVQPLSSRLRFGFALVFKCQPGIVLYHNHFLLSTSFFKFFRQASSLSQAGSPVYHLPSLLSSLFLNFFQNRFAFASLEIPLVASARLVYHFIYLFVKHYF